MMRYIRWDFRQIVLARGDLIETNAKEAAQEAWKIPTGQYVTEQACRAANPAIAPITQPYHWPTDKNLREYVFMDIKHVIDNRSYR